MPNKNPICLDQRPEEPTEYIISKEHENTMIYLTVKIELKEKNWQYAAIHNVRLKKTDLFPSKIPEPKDLKLDYAKHLDKHELKVSSHVSRFREGAEENTPAIVKYTLLIEAGDKLLDSFTLESDSNNPSDFYSKILFKLS